MRVANFVHGSAANEAAWLSPAVSTRHHRASDHAGVQITLKRQDISSFTLRYEGGRPHVRCIAASSARNVSGLPVNRFCG